MKAYLVSAGSYSDYSIVAVYLNKEDAEQFVKQHNTEKVSNEAKSSWMWINDLPTGIVPNYNENYIKEMKSVSIEDYVQQQIKERLVDNEWGDYRIEEFDIDGSLPPLIEKLLKDSQ